jgi:hypothetical protein
MLNVNKIALLMTVSLIGCNAPTSSTSTTDTASFSTQSLSASAHSDCSLYAVVGRNWRNSNFVPSVGTKYTDDLEINSACRIRRSYCNQEWYLPDTMNKDFTSKQTINLNTTANSYDGCFTVGTTTCTIQLAYDSTLQKFFIALNCPGTRVPSMSYIEN